MSDLEVLVKTIESLKPLTDEGRHDFLQMWSAHNVKRKELITAAGDVEKYLYFVTEGVQRIVYHDNQDREATLVFRIHLHLVVRSLHSSCKSLRPIFMSRSHLQHFCVHHFTL
jgi:hypothetical protein